MSEQNTNNVLLLMDSKRYIYHEQIGTKVISSVEQ